MATQIHRKIRERTSNERKTPKKNKDQHEGKSLKSPNESKHDKTTTRHHKTKGMGSKKQNCQSLEILESKLVKFGFNFPIKFLKNYKYLSLLCLISLYVSFFLFLCLSLPSQPLSLCFPPSRPPTFSLFLSQSPISYSLSFPLYPSSL